MPGGHRSLLYIPLVSQCTSQIPLGRHSLSHLLAAQTSIWGSTMLHSMGLLFKRQVLASRALLPLIYEMLRHLVL